MKKRIRIPTRILLVAALFIASFIIYCTINASGKTPIVPKNNLTTEQIKAQIYLFDKALNEFGAESPKQAVDIWAKGFKERNGVMQYSVLCDALKEAWIKDMGEPASSYWIIGTSSPWLGDYTIIKNKKFNSSYEITVKLHWVASGNYSSYEEKTLTVVNKSNKWCIQNIK